jgi:hypothetical protein
VALQAALEMTAGKFPSPADVRIRVPDASMPAETWYRPMRRIAFVLAWL